MDRWAWLLKNVRQERIKVDSAILRQLEEQQRVEEVARTIRDMRKAQGLTQAELANRVGSTHPSLARFESGKVPNVGYVRRLLEALGAV